MKNLLLTLTAFAAATVLSVAPASAASMLEIRFTGFDVVYTGTDLVDAGSPLGGLLDPSESDALNSVTFLLDGVTLGSFTSNVYADLGQFANVNIPSSGGTATWSSPGFFDIFSTSLGWNLGLDLGSMALTYAPAGTPALVANATVSGIYSQSLPFNLLAGTPVALSLTFDSISDITTRGQFLSGFEGTAAGDINATAVPEPSSMLLLGTGVAALVRRRFRRAER